MDAKVLDKKGVWVYNRSQFRMIDSTDENNQVILESGVPTKVKMTKWIEDRLDTPERPGVLVECPDPNTTDDSEMPSVMTNEDQTTVPVDPDTGIKSLGAAPGVAGTTAADTAAKNDSRKK